MTGFVRAFAALFLAVTMLQLTVAPAEATKGIEWCVKDPIFEIDGRVVQVIVLVPTTHQSAKVHYVLSVPEGSQVRWWLPPGEVLTGTVRIVADDDLDEDEASLRVTGEGPEFPVRVQVSGAGLRTAPFEIYGTSQGTRVRLRLQRTTED